MNTSSFLLSAQKNFGFLIDDFGYSIQDKRYDPNNPWSDGVIEFISPRTTIRVQKDRGAFIVFVKPTGEPEVSRMSLPWILEALSVMSSDDFPGEASPAEYDNVLNFNARLLKMHCMSMILGNFSRWLNVLKYFVDQSKSGYLSRTGKQLPDRVHQEREDYIKSKKAQGHYP